MRPLLVLLLVAAAVGAFFFAMNLGQDSLETPPEVAVPGSKAAPVAEEPRDEDLVPAAAPTSAGRNATTASPVPRTDVTAGDAVVGNAIRGVVQLPDGTRVANAQVTLSPFDLFTMVGGPAEPGSARTFTTGGNGAFAFLDVEPYQEYSLVAAHPQHGRRVENHLQVSDGEARDGVVIVLQPGARFFGRVIDSGGNPVVGAELFLGMSALGTTEDDPSAVRVTSDASGQYAFQNVSEGNYSLDVRAEGYGRTSLQQLNVTGKEDHEQNIELEVAHMVAGRVVDLAGAPIAGASVQAYSSGGSGAARGQQTRSETQTEETGEFLIDDIRAGSYTLFVVADGYRSDRVMRVESGDMSVQVQLSPLPRVYGQVLEDGGQPARSFLVNLRMPIQGGDSTVALRSNSAEVRDSTTGEFELACPNVGEYIVEARVPGYAPSFSDSFTVTEGGTQRGVVVRLSRGGSITGRIVDHQGQPIVGARIQTHDSEYVDDAFFRQLGEYPSQATEATGRSGDDGTFRIDGLTDETYQLDIRHGQFAQLIRTDIVVHAGQVATLGDLRLSSGATVRGRVLGPNGAPLAGATVQLRVENENGQNATGRTDAEGRYEIDHVPSGSYSISAQRPQDPNNPFQGPMDMKKTQRTISVSEGQKYTEDFTISN